MANNKPIRILQVLTAMNRAGTETMLMNLYRAMDRNNIQFDFAVTTVEHCDYDDEIEMMGGKLFHYPRYTGKNHFIYKKWWNDFFKVHPEYHIVHGHIGSTASIYLGIAKKYGRYTIAHSHNTGGKLTFQSAIYKAYAYNTRYIADFFIGCSTEALISRYGKKVANNKSRSVVLNNGIVVQQYAFSEEVKDKVREELGLEKNAFVVGTVGRLTEQKNIFFIVDILAELKKKIPNYHFIWAGTGELKEQVEQYIKEKDLQRNVHLLGVRNDIHRILQSLNVFILPSKYEGLPVIGVEVQAAGVPMLCSDKVSLEVNMSKCVSFLSIESIEPWVEGILKEKDFRRVEDAPSDVIKAGYDIKTTSQWLKDFYELNWHK